MNDNKQFDPRAEFQQMQEAEQQLLAQQAQQPQQQIIPQPYETDDPNKYELEIDPYLDKLENQLLGKRLIEGTWINDPNRKLVMNDLGVSEFMGELRFRVSINMQMSELEQNDPIVIAAEASKVFADKIEDHWEEWDITPSESNFESIALRLYHSLLILLLIAKKGGMRKHREKRGKAIYPGQQMEEVI